MKGEKFTRKRNALSRLNPIDLSEKWLRFSRIGVLIFAVIIVRVTMSTLPVFDITAVHDNILQGFAPFQSHLQNDLLLSVLQLTLLCLISTFLLFTMLHFVLWSDTLKLPLMLTVFYTVKFLSDTCLHIRRPKSTLWVDLPYLTRDFVVSNLFHSNVDLPTGLLCLCLIHFLSIKRKFVRRLMILTVLATTILVDLLQFCLQTSHSYAVFSAVIISGFSHIMSDGLLTYCEETRAQRRKARSTITSISSDIEFQDFFVLN